MLRYIGGSNINQVLVRSRYILNKGKIPVINYIKEKNNLLDPLNFNNDNSVEREYNQIIPLLNNNLRVALKLSSLNFNYNSCSNLISKFILNGIEVMIDAENSKYNKQYNDISNLLINDFNKDKVNIFKTYQMYRKDSLLNLENDIKINQDLGNYLGVKLVRGAYWNQEKDNLELFTNKYETDMNYNRAILILYEKEIKSILATHNDESINLGLLLNDKINDNSKKFEFAHLLGMNVSKYELIKDKYKVNVYLPYGPYNYMIPYLTRRLYENIDMVKYMFK